MENHHDHHEEPKPSNKWITTPIIMAILVIGCVVTFLGMASGTCCDGKCNEKAKTEQHGTGHEEEHGTTHDDHGTTTEVKDSTAVDSTAAVNNGAENHGEEHGENHGH